MPSTSELAARLERAEHERDQALTELGRARAELDALRLALKSRGEPEPPLYPDSAAPVGPPPARYVVVDFLNDLFKQVAGPVHRRLRGGTGHGRR